MEEMMLTIEEGSEFKIKVESFDELDKSFFREIYIEAAINVKDITNNTENYYKNKDTNKFYKDNEEANNIIAFVGDRGTGKSSSMITFLEALKELNHYYKKNISNWIINSEIPVYKEFSSLIGYNFLCLDIIDPALLESSESIFEIVIAKMFSIFRDYLDENEDRVEFDDKRRLLKKFQNVYNNLKIINNDRKQLFKDEGYSENVLETLVNLASGSNMRTSFIELVNEMLGMLCKNGEKEKRFLVIPIDDLDMNIKQSALMAEQIRKYLMVPNIIILMAVKVEQLKDSIEQTYRENYKFMIEGGNKLSEDPKEMVEKYVEKLIPNGRKLFLPDIRIEKEKKINLEFITKKKIECNETKSRSKLTIQERVLELTYIKTGLLFLKPKQGTHYLVPENIRELQNYLTILNKMEDVSPKASVDIKVSSLKKFEDYFLKVWIKRNLSWEQIKFLEEFISTDVVKKNKLVVTKFTKIINNQLRNSLEEKVYDNFITKDFSKKMFMDNPLFDINNNPVNISIGDVLSVLSIYEEYDDIETKKLKFAIKTLYSIYLYKSLIIEPTDYENLITLIGANIFSTTNKKVLSENKVEFKIYDYLNLKIGQLCLSEQIQSICKKAILVSFFKNYSELENVKKTFEENELKILDISLNDEEIRIIQTIEFLFNFIFIGEENVKDTYRINKTAYYDVESNFSMMSREYKNARFDITAYMYNSLMPEKIVERTFKKILCSIESSEILDSLEEYVSQYYIQTNLYDDLMDKLDKVTTDTNEMELLIKSASDIIGKVSICSEIITWRDEHKVIIPFYSMELIEQICLQGKSFQKSDLSSNASIFKNFQKFFEYIYSDVGEILLNQKYFSNRYNMDNYLTNSIKNYPLTNIITGEGTKNDRIQIRKENIEELIDSIEHLVLDTDRVKWFQQIIKDIRNNKGYKSKEALKKKMSEILEKKGSLSSWLEDKIKELYDKNEKLSAASSNSETREKISYEIIDLLKEEIEELKKA